MPAEDSDTGSPTGELAEAVGRAALAGDVTIVAAESLTSGAIAATLGQADDASTWFTGSVVAYSTEMKQLVLGLEPGPVINEVAARQMAQGALEATRASVVVAVTGVGGPGPQEGHPAGTVFLACGSGRDGIDVHELHLEGDPAQVVDRTVHAALSALLRELGAG